MSIQMGSPFYDLTPYSSDDLRRGAKGSRETHAEIAARSPEEMVERVNAGRQQMLDEHGRCKAHAVHTWGEPVPPRDESCRGCKAALTRKSKQPQYQPTTLDVERRSRHQLLGYYAASAQQAENVAALKDTPMGPATGPHSRSISSVAEHGMRGSSYIWGTN